MPRFPGVLVAGNVVYDILVRPVGEIRWDTTSWVESIEQHLGGNGANTSYTLGKLGIPVRLLARVGRDAFGEECLGWLVSAGVDLSAVERSESRTATTVGLVHSSGARLFLHRPGASADALAGPIEFTAELADGYDRFHLANPFALPRIRPLAAETLRLAKAAGLATSLDTGWDARGEWLELIGPCLPWVDLLFVNEEEAKVLGGKEDPIEAARKLRSLGACEAVVKLGGRGCAVVTEEEEILTPAFEIPVVDTTGAGDCFAGAYLAALSRGVTCAEAARFANAVGALSIQKLGATEGVLSWTETQAWMGPAGKGAP